MGKIKVEVINHGLSFVPDSQARIYTETRRDTKIGKFRTMLRVRDMILEVAEWPRDRKNNQLKVGATPSAEFVAACIAAIPRRSPAPATQPSAKDIELEGIYREALDFLASRP